MRITASFVASRPVLALPLVAVLSASALIFVIVGIWLVAGVIDMRSERPRLEARLARISEQISSVAPHDPLPPASNLESMRQRVYTLNKLSGVHGWSTPQLLAWLEGQIPESVHLVSLHHKPRDGEALLVAESYSAEALTNFLLRLEKEPHFSEVLLSKQGTRSAPGSNAVQFEIRLRWKS